VIKASMFCSPRGTSAQKGEDPNAAKRVVPLWRVVTSNTLVRIWQARKLWDIGIVVLFLFWVQEVPSSILGCPLLFFLPFALPFLPFIAGSEGGVGAARREKEQRVPVRHRE
jgi:hypothetical protein